MTDVRQKITFGLVGGFRSLFRSEQFFLRSLAVRDINDCALDQRPRRTAGGGDKRGGDQAPKYAAIGAAEAHLVANDAAFLAQSFHKSFSIPRLKVIVSGVSPENLLARRAPREVNKGFVTILDGALHRGKKDCSQARYDSQSILDRCLHPMFLMSAPEVQPHSMNFIGISELNIKSPLPAVSRPNYKLLSASRARPGRQQEVPSTMPARITLKNYHREMRGMKRPRFE